MSKLFEKIHNRIPPYKKRMIGMSMDIASQIYEYMKESEMTQRELANELGKSESEISKWLTGSHNFTLESIAKIEEVFDKKIILVPMFAAKDPGLKYEKKDNKRENQLKASDGKSRGILL